MVKKVKIKVPPKGVGKLKDLQRIYLNTRVKIAMGCWHPKVNPKLHRYKYLHGSVMMACGYRKWVVWWDDSYNWNHLYTGDVYHSAGLKICNAEDVQGFWDIPIRERVKYITDTMDYEMENTNENDHQDSSTNGNTELTFNLTNPHAKFIHYNTITPLKNHNLRPFDSKTIYQLIATSFALQLLNLKTKTTINNLMIRLKHPNIRSLLTPLTLRNLKK